MATNNEEFAARQRRLQALRAEIASLGFAPVAEEAAELILTFSRASNYGLDGCEDRLLASRIRTAIHAYEAAHAIGKAA